MADSAPSAAGVVDAKGTVCADCLCQSCGYNLRGLKRDGRCPECAAPVSMSVRGDLLCYAEPGYVSKLARGSRWIMRGLTVQVLAVLLALLAAITLALAVPGGRGATLAGVCLVLAGLGVLAGLLALLSGLWFITAPDPRVFEPDRRETGRRLVRIYILVALLGAGLELLVAELAPPPRLMALFQFLALGPSLLGVIGAVAYFLHLQRLARRIHDPSADVYRRLTRPSGSLARWFGVVLGALLAVEAVGVAVDWGPVLTAPPSVPPAATPLRAATSPAPGPGPWPTVRSCSGGLGALLLLILLLRAVRLHQRLRKALERQAAMAAEFWRSP